MAVFADRSLPKQQPSPLAMPKAGPSRSIPSYGSRPPAINDSAVQAVVNNQRAAGAGQQRAALMDMNRAGMSLGRGQQRMADMSAAGADAQSRTDAARTEMGAANANAAANREYDNTMRSEKIGNSGLLEGLRSANVMANVQKQGWQQDLYEALRRGQFGLDSIYLDTSGLAGRMFGST